MDSMMCQNMMNQKVEENATSLMMKNNEEPNRRMNMMGLGIINLIFRKGYDRCTIQCLESQKVSEVIKKFREKSAWDKPNIKYIYYYNGKQINESLSVFEAGLKEYGNILVKKANEIIGGGFPMLFSDVSKNKTKELTISKKAPSYRKITKGINIFGICKFKKCLAYQKEVVVRIKKKV